MSDPIRDALNMLDAVLCDPQGRSSIRGSVADNAIIDEALGILRTALAQPAELEALKSDIADALATITAQHSELEALRASTASVQADQRAENDRLRAERDALKQTLHDELDSNLRLRELGGARPDEPMTVFLERVIAERDAAVSGALDAMRQFARDNQPHEYNGVTQDPCGVHAWLARFDAARTGVAK